MNRTLAPTSCDIRVSRSSVRDEARRYRSWSQTTLPLMTSALVSYSYYKKSYSYSCDLRWHPLRSSHRAIPIQISLPKPPNCDDFYRDRWQRSILSYFSHKLKWSNLILTLLVLVGHFQCKFIITKHQILPTFRRFRNLPPGASPLHGNTSQSSSSHSVSNLIVSWQPV